ncbi:MAG: NAD-dependent epimerase/dehydratase family protein [Leptospiraceae bacterium]|nr:NAD-dependent epimerase/dehydratase family protein [Leptospiraceae bacterium]
MGKAQSILVTGTTGMIGGLVLDQCLNSQDMQRVYGLGRRPSGRNHPGLTEFLMDDLDSLESLQIPPVDAVIFCAGVYTGAVPDQEFHSITIDYPVRLANLLLAKNSNLRFCLLSGAGADRSEKSRMIFARSKGAAENRLASILGDSFYAFRPAYIYPVEPRKEPNISYSLMRFLYPLVNAVSNKYSIKSTELAEAMVDVALNGCEKHILENSDILTLLNGQGVR